MNQLIPIGRLNFALGMAGLGIQQFFFPGFRPVFVPMWPEGFPNPQVLIYLSSVGLITAAAFLILNYKPRTTSLILGTILLLLFIVCHLPFQFNNHPFALGSWTNALKILALSGGSFVVSGSFPDSQGHADAPFGFLEKLVPLGRIFVAIMLIVFGIDHFLYDQFVQTLVPVWIPFPLFWTYVAGIALIGAGFSFLTKIKIRLVGILSAVMIFLWLLILHIPRALAMPELDNGNEITSVFQALAFSGVALLIAFYQDEAQVTKRSSRKFSSL